MNLISMEMVVWSCPISSASDVLSKVLTRGVLSKIAWISLLRRWLWERSSHEFWEAKADAECFNHHFYVISHGFFISFLIRFKYLCWATFFFYKSLFKFRKRSHISGVVFVHEAFFGWTTVCRIDSYAKDPRTGRVKFILC